MAEAGQTQVEAVSGAVESLVVEGVQLVCDVITHDQSEDLGEVAMFGKEQVKFLSPPGNVFALGISSQCHLKEYNINNVNPISLSKKRIWLFVFLYYL